MTNYGFAIDQRTCIGCHACTVACKMENQVPLGVFRTWVKYIEKGSFPDTRRYFSFATGDLVRVTTKIGHFVIVAMRTEGIRPGIVAASHHMGRWRLDPERGMDRWSSALADIREVEPGRWRVRQLEGVRPFPSDDPDSRRVWWNDAGVHQNLTFPVQPDPVSGMHCWHQQVRVEPAHLEDDYGDVVVDTGKAHEVYRRWLSLTRPGPGPEGLRRPMWMFRPLKPHPSAYWSRTDRGR